MSLVSDAVPLCRVLPATLRANNAALASALFAQAIDIFVDIVQNGLIHGDFNEFNLLVDGLADNSSSDNEESEAMSAKLILIDFPQMISRDHRSAQEWVWNAFEYLQLRYLFIMTRR